jgi:hypothetical protein
MAEREGFRHSPIATLGLRARIPSHSTFSLCARLWRSEMSSGTRPSLRSGFGHESLPTAHSLCARLWRSERDSGTRPSLRSGFGHESLPTAHSLSALACGGARRLHALAHRYARASGTNPSPQHILSLRSPVAERDVFRLSAAHAASSSNPSLSAIQLAWPPPSGVVDFAQASRRSLVGRRRRLVRVGSRRRSRHERLERRPTGRGRLRSAALISDIFATDIQAFLCGVPRRPPGRPLAHDRVGRREHLQPK